jgi:hypothetical protein
MASALGAAVLAATIIITTPAQASFTECTVKKGIDILNRPDGHLEGRFTPLEKGEKVAIRDTYQDWVFVLHFVTDHNEYGWIKRNSVDSCKAMDGTP